MEAGNTLHALDTSDSQDSVCSLSPIWYALALLASISFFEAFSFVSVALSWLLVSGCAPVA